MTVFEGYSPNAMGGIAIVSGGLDSVVMAYTMAHVGYELNVLSFDYGQRHRKELECARRCAERLHAKFDLVDLSAVGALLDDNALTGAREVPDGHYEANSMRVTVVPNRNAIMLSVALAVAASRGAQAVAMGVHTGDHHIYADCRKEFVDAFREMERMSLAGIPHIDILTPFIEVPKWQIVWHGSLLGVPFEDTWSCYRGGEIHCGKCGTCTERKEAFKLSGVSDPTEYAE